MPAIEMVSRPSLPTKERTRVPAAQSAPTRELFASQDTEHRECVSHRPVILDAFDKIIDYDDRYLCPT